jgi:hypothetical protein
MPCSEVIMKDQKLLSLNTVTTLTLMCLLCGSLIGCYSAAVDYDLGWTTRRVSGQVEDVVSGKPVGGSFIIVKECYGSFAGNETSEAGNFIPRARLLHSLKEDGSFEMDFDWRASQFELNFVGQGYEVHRFRFQRQLGVGNLHYVAKMMPSSNWDDELVLGVTPLVQNLLLEPGYRLPEPDQLFLGEWLAKQRQENFGKE